MNDDDLTRQLRDADVPVTPDPRFADRLYADLARELAFPSAQSPSVAVVRGRPGARRGMALLAAALLLIILAAALGVVGARLLERRNVVAPPSGWAGFRGDAARRGEGSDGPTGSPVLRWRFQANGAVPGNVSVAGDLAYAASDEGVLHALDVATGEKRWSFESDQPPLGGPMIDSGVAFVFDGVGILHAIDAATGDERWQTTIPLLGPSGPAIADGVAYAGSGDGVLVAIDATDGTERWRTPISATGAAYTPAVADGRVYVASDGGGFVAVDAADGTIDWRFDTGDRPLGTAVVADGLAYIGAGGSDVSATGILWALDAASGAERWRVERPIFSPAVSNGVAFSGSVDLGVFALDTTSGEELWSFLVHGDARAPAVAEGVVYLAASHEHRVYGLDAMSGAELWRFDVDEEMVCCIGVADGAVFVGTQLGGIYAISGDEADLPPKD